MNVLYLSLLCSKNLLEMLRTISNSNPGYAGQKFDRLIIEGLIKNGCSCLAVSSIPVNRAISKKRWWNIADETYNGIRIKYLPFLNYPFLRQLSLFIFTVFSVLKWGLKNRKDKVIIADVLNFAICGAGMLVAKLLGIRIIGVVTDMPGLLVNAGGTKENFFSKFKSITKFMEKSIYHYDGYVFLTEQMNSVINIKQVPYIVMEGLVDSEICKSEYPLSHTTEKIILYAGGLHVRYGLKTLVEAFMKIHDADLRLCIFGSGPFAHDLQSYYTKLDHRIVYKGVVSNEEIIAAEKASLLLVNPRPTKEAFTLYSFPSKNMEYMVSGRPLLTTKLPGMPPEYHKYVYLFNEESVVGYVEALESVLNLSPEELDNKGREAKAWILENKNNIAQSSRIIKLINRLN